MFRNPEADAAAVVERLRTEQDAGRRKVLLEVLAELPERQREHVEGMRAIGQPAERLDDFLAARREAVRALEAWQPGGAADTQRRAVLERLRKQGSRPGDRDRPAGQKETRP